MLQHLPSHQGARKGDESAESEQKQTLTHEHLEEVLQEGCYKHSLVPLGLSFSFVLRPMSGCLGSKPFPSQHSVPGKAVSANKGPHGYDLLSYAGKLQLGL